ncbi:MAG: CoA transferase [Betaproteobacteria bacterium]|nr:CoA transferase [Betaproteobacteria bacterium]
MGPLTGLRVIEVGGIGPGPFCGMMLADMGAEVVRIERAAAAPGEPPPRDPLLRNRRSLALDLKNPAGVALLLRLLERADALFEGFRPGVAERLGFGPDICLARNPRLVYGRMTGWGQDGPLARAAGHDLNYIALAGALGLMGPRGGKPVPPLNLVGDFGGGGMLLAFGMVCALLEASRSGRGQVVDAAMVDGVVALLAMFFGLRAAGRFRDATGENPLAGAPHYYGSYETADGGFVTIAPLEPQFWRLFLDKLGLDPARFGLESGWPEVSDELLDERWPRLKAELAAVFRTKTRDEWCALLEGTDVCFAPVLGLEEAARHPHNRARGNFIEVDGVLQNAPAPRFSRTAADVPRPPRRAGEDGETVLRDWGLGEAEIGAARGAGALA